MKIRIVLVEPESEGNIGSVARAMKNFDVAELYIVNPKALIAGEAVALAAHGADILKHAYIVEKLGDATKDANFVVGTTGVAGRQPSNLLRTCITPREFAEKLPNLDGTVAILLGRESIGLTNDELEKCDFLISIPANPAYPILNVAMAAAIILYEIYNARTGWPEALTPAPDPRLKGLLISFFERACYISEVPDHKRRLAIRAFRNVVGRAFTSQREVTLLLGVFRGLVKGVKRGAD